MAYLQVVVRQEALIHDISSAGLGRHILPRRWQTRCFSRDMGTLELAQVGFETSRRAIRVEAHLIECRHGDDKDDKKGEKWMRETAVRGEGFEGIKVGSRQVRDTSAVPDRAQATHSSSEAAIAHYPIICLLQQAYAQVLVHLTLVCVDRAP
jgi:hypothetical protein